MTLLQEAKAENSTASVSRSILSTPATMKSSMFLSTTHLCEADAHHLWQATVVALLRHSSIHYPANAEP
jgi:hypothetical protein